LYKNYSCCHITKYTMFFDMEKAMFFIQKHGFWETHFSSRKI